LVDLRDNVIGFLSEKLSQLRDTVVALAGSLRERLASALAAMRPLIEPFIQSVSVLIAVNDKLAAVAGVSSASLHDLANSYRTAGSAAGEAGRRTGDIELATEQAGAAAGKATPLVTTLGSAVQALGTSATTTAGAVRGLAAPLQQQTTLVTRSLDESAKLRMELERWALVNSAVLAPSITQVSAALTAQQPIMARQMTAWAQFAPTVQQNTAQASEGIGGFFSKVFGNAQQFGQNVSNIFAQAFTGGGGALGAVKAFSTQALSSLMGLIPGIGPFVSAFAGPIVEMLSKLGKKFQDFFRTVFGGPSRGELNDRAMVAEFEESMIAGLTAAQQAEAGGERWKQVVIALRDKYIELGMSEADALRDAERLWKSSQEGGEETWRVIDEINRKLAEQRAAADAAANASEDGGETATDAAEDTRDAAAATTEEYEHQAAAAKDSGDAMEAAAEKAAEAFAKMGRALEQLPTEIDILIRGRYRAPDLPEAEYDGAGFASGTMGRFGQWFGRFSKQGTRTTLHGPEAVLTPAQAVPFAADVMAATAPQSMDTRLPSVRFDVPSIKDPGSGLHGGDVLRELQGVNRKLDDFTSSLAISIRDAVMGAV
jgi:hypothetical protein